MSEENQRFRIIKEVARVLVDNQTHNKDEVNLTIYLPHLPKCVCIYICIY